MGKATPTTIETNAPLSLNHLYYFISIPLLISTVIVFVQLNIIFSFYHLIALLFLWISAKRSPLSKHLPSTALLSPFKSGVRSIKSLFYLLLALFFMSFMIAQASLPLTLSILLSATLGHWLLFGLSQTPTTADNTYNTTLHEAKDQLSNIASEIPKLNNDSLQKALDEILQKGSTMIDLVAQEPQSLRQTRAFFVEHMSSVIGVLQAYTTLESQKVDQKLEQKLYTLVNDVSQRFSQEIEKLTYAKTNASTQENATKE